MKTSPSGIKFIAEHEGEILKVYKDPIGLPTLGVGHLLSKAELAEMPVGTKITKEQSREYLAKDLARFERAITAAVKVPLTQNQFDALVSFSFNIGESAFQRSSCRRKLNEKNYVGAADAMLAWNKAGGRVLSGLMRRRKEERALFLTPSAAVNATASPTENLDKGINETANQLEGQSPISSDITETKTTEVAQAGGMTTAVEQTIPGGDAPDVPPTLVTKNGPLAKWLFSGGTLGAIGAAIWAYITSNPGVVGMAMLCITALIVVFIFRGAITDAIRMQVAADPDKKNVT